MEAVVLRIAIVAPLVTAIREPQLGGSQALAADIAQGLSGRGCDVTVFAATGSSIAGVDVVDVGVDPADLSQTLFRAGAEGSHDGPARDAFRRAYALVADESFDVVHNHAFDAPAIDLAPSDVPVVHTLHLPPRDDIARAVTRVRAQARAVVACVSRFAAASWQQHVAVDVVLPNGVPVDRIDFSAAGGDGLLFAGRLSPEKGAEEAIEIARRAGRHITVVGDAYDERYASERIEPQRSASVEVRGGIPRDELWGLMGRAGAVLCPARWDEPFGLVAAESQAAGTPVIAFARGALGEVIRDGETGALVTDVDEAVEALSVSYDRSACRAHAEASLSIERTLDAHAALYARLAMAGAR